MKTLLKNFLKVPAILVIALTFTSVSANGSLWSLERTPQDTAFKVFTGRVIDQSTRKPVVFANVYLIGSSLGTVTNAEGEFVLKVPTAEINRKLGISNLGYKNLVINLADLKEKENIIKLELAATPLEQVVIRSDDPVELLKMAYRRINENYNTNHEMQVGFYLETVKQNR